MDNRMVSRHPHRVTLAMHVRAAALGAACLLLAPASWAADDPDCPRPQPPKFEKRGNPDCGTHNMMLVGEETAYLSHLPMFHAEHRFQVILEATFEGGGESLDRVYIKDRKNHRETRMYTVEPSDLFVLSRLFAEPEASRTAFLGTVFHGHLERGGEPIKDLQKINVRVARIIYARELQPKANKSDELHYILFGKGNELFLAHQITQAPDFDQIVGVTVDGHSFTENELQRGVTVRIPNRGNVPAQRLRKSERTEGEGHVTGAHQFLPLQLKVATEFYFEEGELRAHPTKEDFKPTPLEAEAGF
jgi:hypothetical protein